MACFAPPYGLRYAAHCFNRAYAQQRGQTLIPAGGKLGVTSFSVLDFNGSSQDVFHVGEGRAPRYSTSSAIDVKF